MKIAVIGPTYPFRGGISHYNTILCESLLKKHEVISISFTRLYPRFLYPGKNQKDHKSKKKIKIKAVYLIDSVNLFTWFKTFMFIKQKKVDLVIFHWWTPFFSLPFYTICKCIKLFTNIKTLFVCHNVTPHENKLIDKFLIKIVLTNSDFFIVQSKDEFHNLKKLFPRATVEVVYHPTYKLFDFNSITKNEAKKRLKLTNNVILFFGFVREYKGLRYLIDAMQKVRKEIDVTLLIVGEFWENKNRYLKLIKKYGIENNVKIVDEYVRNEDIGLYMASADVVVLPYLSATQSGIIQLAYGFNKPVITTDVGGLPDVVENGKTGYVVESRDSDALARAIIRYFKYKKEKEFEKNIKKINYKFSWNTIIKTIEYLAQKNDAVIEYVFNKK